VQQYLSVLPPPYPPLPVKVWENKSQTPTLVCPICGTEFAVAPGDVKCPGCGSSFVVAEWNQASFLVGIGVGLLFGMLITAGVYYFVIKPVIPKAALDALLRSIF
jgi:uncharacterized Zn-finger protein